MLLFGADHHPDTRQIQLSRWSVIGGPWGDGLGLLCVKSSPTPTVEVFSLTRTSSSYYLHHSLDRSVHFQAKRLIRLQLYH